MESVSIISTDSVFSAPPRELSPGTHPQRGTTTIFLQARIKGSTSEVIPGKGRSWALCSGASKSAAVACEHSPPSCWCSSLASQQSRELFCTFRCHTDFLSIRAHSWTDCSSHTKPSSGNEHLHEEWIYSTANEEHVVYENFHNGKKNKIKQNCGKQQGRHITKSDNNKTETVQRKHPSLSSWPKLHCCHWTPDDFSLILIFLCNKQWKTRKREQCNQRNLKGKNFECEGLVVKDNLFRSLKLPPSSLDMTIPQYFRVVFFFLPPQPPTWGREPPVSTCWE